MIACWKITVPALGTGVAVVGNPAPIAASFIVSDVAALGPGPGTAPAGPGAVGVKIDRASGAVRVGHVTAEQNWRGIEAQRGGTVATPVAIVDNVVRGNFQGFLLLDNPAVEITGNLGLDSVGWCFNGPRGTTTGVLHHNTCRGGGGRGFALGAAGVDVTGNVAEDVAGPGFEFTAGTPHGNSARRNSTGFAITGQSVVMEGNTADSNIVGFDITTATQSTLRDNTATHNASTGFQGFAIQNPFGPAQRNTLENNHVGWNPFGIVFEFMNNSNQVSGTEWLDGHTSYIRWTDPNTIVDAGSHYRGMPGTDTRFHDWIATATVGNDPTLVAGLRPEQIAVVTSATWDFGDGSERLVLPRDPLQGHGPPPDVTHQYGSVGEYTATLTVNGLNNLGEPITLTDTTKVTIVDVPATGALPLPAGHEPWPSLANDPARTFFNGAETTITPANVAGLGVKWRFPTTEPVTATPAVATIDIGGTPTEAVFDGSYSGTMYAVRASNGSPLWINCLIEGGPEPFCDPQSPQQDPDNPDADRQQAYGAIVDSPAVAKVALPGGVSEDRVFVGVGGAHAHLVALNANNGEERWRFTAATSAPTYSISGSPIVVGDTVYFGMDCNNQCDNGGGIFALDAVTGNLKWFWDVHSGRNFVAPPGTMEFDPGQMRGSDAVPLQRDCGAVWSSPAIDSELGLAFVGTADCTHIPMTEHEEAVVALNLQTGAPVWHFQPRQIDKRDMDFGATPNVFKIGDRHVVGAGDKNGIYYALDAQSGDEIWSTKLALGGNFGGFYGTATDGESIYLTNAIGEATDFQTAHEERLKGMEWALDARTGNVLWTQHLGSPTVGMNSVSPGIYWSTGLDHNLHAWDSETGDPLGVWNVQGAASSAPAIADGHVYVGAGTGATYRAAVGDGAPDPLGTGAGEITFPHPVPVTEYGQGIYSFCLTSEADCIESRADPESAKSRTVVTYNGAATGDHHDDVTVSGALHDAIVEPLGFPIEGATLKFEIGNGSCTGITDSAGVATCALHVDAQPGANTVKTSYAGDDLRRASDDFDGFIVTKEQTAVAYTGPAQLTNTETVELAAALTEDDGAPAPGGAVTFTVGTGGSAQSCTGTSDAGGMAECAVTLRQAVGSTTVSIDFPGNDFYGPSQGSAAVTVVTPRAGGQESGPGAGSGDQCPAERSSATLGVEPPTGAGGAVAGATIGFPFASRRFGRSRRRGRGRGALLPLVVGGALMALTLSGCGFFGGAPPPGC